MMDYNIQDLYNRSSEALINAMKQHIKFIGINSSIRSLDIQFHYIESLQLDNVITKYELLDKQSKRQNLMMEQEFVKQDIILQIHKSIIHALALVDISIRMRNRFSLEMSKTLVQNILKFIIENKSNISIPRDTLTSQIMTVYANLIKSEYKGNTDLVNALSQLMSA